MNKDGLCIDKLRREGTTRWAGAIGDYCGQIERTRGNEGFGRHTARSSLRSGCGIRRRMWIVAGRGWGDRANLVTKRVGTDVRSNLSWLAVVTVNKRESHEDSENDVDSGPHWGKYKTGRYSRA